MSDDQVAAICLTVVAVALLWRLPSILDRLL